MKEEWVRVTGTNNGNNYESAEHGSLYLGGNIAAMCYQKEVWIYANEDVSKRLHYINDLSVTDSITNYELKLNLDDIGSFFTITDMRLALVFEEHKIEVNGFSEENAKFYKEIPDYGIF